MYELPFFKQAKWAQSMKRTSIILAIVFIPIGIFSFKSIIEESVVMGILSGIVMFILPVFCLYTFFFGSKKSYVELSEEYIKVSTPFKIFKANWNEIEAIYEYNTNNNDMVGFLLKKDIKKRTKRSILNNLNETMGQPPISFNISKQMYSDIDYKKFMRTIQNQILLKQNEIEDYNYMFDTESDDNNDNIVKAIIISLITTISTSVIYGGSIALFNQNLIIIPILLCFFIIAVFNKYYIEKEFNIFIRFWLGFLSAIQIPLGYINVFLIESFEYLDIYSIGQIIRLNFEDILTSISATLIAIVMMIICFGIGAVSGRVSNDKV